MHQICPDGGACHHNCASSSKADCYRARFCLPLGQASWEDYPERAASTAPPSVPATPLPTIAELARLIQPRPEGEGAPVVEHLLPDLPDDVADGVRARRDFGLEKYGTLLRVGNGRDALADLAQEALDCLIYTRLCRMAGVDVSMLAPVFEALGHEFRCALRGGPRT